MCAVVAKTEEMVFMDTLKVNNGRPKTSEDVDGEDTEEALPTGGKTFEERAFSSGLLNLPPHTKKPREFASFCEVCFNHRFLAR